MIIGFYRGWKLTLVILSLSPILFICAVLFTKIAESLSKNELKSYAKAGAVAEEVFAAIRTVFAFNGSRKEHVRYVEKLEMARKSGIKKGVITGFLFGVVWIVINGGRIFRNILKVFKRPHFIILTNKPLKAYALGFWYGWTLTIEDEYTVGRIVLVFFSIIQRLSALYSRTSVLMLLY